MIGSMSRSDWLEMRRAEKLSVRAISAILVVRSHQSACIFKRVFVEVVSLHVVEGRARVADSVFGTCDAVRR